MTTSDELGPSPRTTARLRLSDERPSPEEVVERLSQVPLLQALPPEEAHALVPYVERVEVPDGQRVVKQGDVGDALYIVDEGTARVQLDDGTLVGRAEPGDVFGEMALLAGEPRSASVVADTDLSLLRIERDDFDEVVRASPRLEAALRELADQHRAGLELARPAPLRRGAWRGRVLRALAARRRGCRAGI